MKPLFDSAKLSSPEIMALTDKTTVIAESIICHPGEVPQIWRMSADGKESFTEGNKKITDFVDLPAFKRGAAK